MFANALYYYSLLTPQARKMLVVTGTGLGAGLCAQSYLELKGVQAKANASIQKSNNEVITSRDEVQRSHDEVLKSNNELTKFKLDHEARMEELRSFTI